MRIRALLLLVAVLAGCGDQGGSATAPAPAGGQPALASDDDKVLYAIGLALGRQLTGLGLSEPDVAKVTAGLGDAVLDRPKQVELEAMMPKVQEFAKRKAAAAAETEKKAGADFLAKAAGEAGASKTASGLVIVHTKEGTGASPKPVEKV
jgi:FKBP-type peptidyl-prolyl cis-trans isomerase FkpA/FKBP-type peptidyl-prolyl cis-trans isomerase FklB